MAYIIFTQILSNFKDSKLFLGAFFLKHPVDVHLRAKISTGFISCMKAMRSIKAFLFYPERKCLNFTSKSGKLQRQHRFLHSKDKFSCLLVIKLTLARLFIAQFRLQASNIYYFFSNMELDIPVTICVYNFGSRHYFVSNLDLFFLREML